VEHLDAMQDQRSLYAGFNGVDPSENMVLAGCVKPEKFWLPRDVSENIDSCLVHGCCDSLRYPEDFHITIDVTIPVVLRNKWLTEARPIAALAVKEDDRDTKLDGGEKCTGQSVGCR